jgi:hypothetical protein
MQKGTAEANKTFWDSPKDYLCKSLITKLAIGHFLDYAFKKTEGNNVEWRCTNCDQDQPVSKKSMKIMMATFKRHWGTNHDTEGKYLILLIPTEFNFKHSKMLFYLSGLLILDNF